MCGGNPAEQFRGESRPLCPTHTALPHSHVPELLLTLRGPSLHMPSRTHTLWDTRAQVQSRSLETNTLDCSPPSSPSDQILRPSALRHQGCPISREASHNPTQELTRRHLWWFSFSLHPAGLGTVQAVGGEGGASGGRSVVDRASPTHQQYGVGANANEAARPLGPTDPRKGCAHMSTPNDAG